MGKKFLAIVTGLVAMGCAPKKVLCPADYRVDFGEAQVFAARAAAAYESDSAVTAFCGADSCFIFTGTRTKARAFVERDDSAKVQWVAFRGTQTLSDIRVDADYTQVPDSVLGIYLHRGFAAAVEDVLPDIIPHLRAGYRTNLTGHSLGGAAAAIAALRLSARGYPVKCITFGQPKVTNAEGAEKSKNLDLTRFIHGKDLVAVVPPLDWKPGKTLGAYEHFGREVILDGAGFECLQEHFSKRFHPDLWPDEAQAQALEDHRMAGYQAKLSELAGHQALGPVP